MFLFVEVPGLAVAFVAVCTHEEESAVLSVVANKVCAVVQSFLARPAQTKPVFVAFFFFFFVQKCAVAAVYFVGVVVSFFFVFDLLFVLVVFFVAGFFLSLLLSVIR